MLFLEKPYCKKSWVAIKVRSSCIPFALSRIHSLICPVAYSSRETYCRTKYVRQLSEGWRKCRGDKDAKINPRILTKGCRKPRAFCRSRAALPVRSKPCRQQAAGSGQHRDRQALLMCCPCRSGSSCLAGRQDAVLVVSTVPLTIETTSFTSEWQQTVGRGESSAGGDLAARRVTAHPRGGSGAALIGDPRANTPGR